MQSLSAAAPCPLAPRSGAQPLGLPDAAAVADAAIPRAAAGRAAGLCRAGAAVASICADDDAPRGDRATALTDLRDKFEERPEFLVSLLSVEGASPALADAVRAQGWR